ncbi:hypothetical protein SAMN06265795_102658 [Noviherbaspirillum humi]|uniref:Uncharacterized protein n=1 Tax=Noviherbaspirillum humi TaxID=1688639 RepID=A0A239EFY0_9BURK|nr:hypothetical protein SAMN06265795_102658 [Noviherbaspirillum humi]
MPWLEIEDRDELKRNLTFLFFSNNSRDRIKVPIVNRGTEPVTLKSWMAISRNNEELAVVPASCRSRTLKPGESCSFHVKKLRNARLTGGLYMWYFDSDFLGSSLYFSIDRFSNDNVVGSLYNH